MELRALYKMTCGFTKIDPPPDIISLVLEQGDLISSSMVTKIWSKLANIKSISDMVDEGNRSDNMVTIFSNCATPHTDTEKTLFAQVRFIYHSISDQISEC